MQFSKSWLQEFFDSSLDAIDLAQTLTIAGIEVEDIQDLSGLSDQIVVGEIVAMEKHPDADRLNVCQVDVGANDLLQIVCGAPNARKGLKIPCAMVGAKLPGFDIKKAKLRGVESFGMLCSAKELGLSQEADGLY
ncbi:MAG: phenylalanine--tRNA ligase subunit beta, partial [Betaproteobacteria bacterium]|nr:phenylalanine--tRNA ligase subunit beta [Betaproteobacteria bacterium]